MPDLLVALVFVAAAGLSFLLGARAPLGLGIGIGAGLLVGLALADQGSFVPALLVTAGPWAAGRLVRSRQGLVDSLARRTRELETEQDAFARLAVQRERARIARELHDIVSHHLAVIVVQAGAGRVASRGNGDSAERLASIRQAGDEALDEISRLADLLADPEGDDGRRHELRVLLDQARATGLKLETTMPAPELSAPAEVERIAYRVVQEGLTNAMKHAPGSEVRLRLLVNPGSVEVELRNRGGKPASEVAATGAGSGIAGMRDRVEAIGGTFEAGPEDGGWRLFAILPTG